MRNGFLEELVIQPTKSTPHVRFHPEGNLVFKGDAYPEDGGLMFEQLFEWISNYIKHSAANTNIIISINHHNDITSKYLLQILKSLKQNCQKFSVCWEHDEGDEDIIFLGNCMSELLEMEFKFHLIY